jgi:hypothetical protein
VSALHRATLNATVRSVNATEPLYVVVLGRLRYDQRTRAYAARRTTEGLSKPEIIRCLKRYVARELYNALQPPKPPEDTADAA